MKYPCETIRDLLPLYIDEICSEQSKAIVEEHLAGCEPCRACCEAMCTTDSLIKKDPEGFSLENGLKNLKKRVNRRFLKISIAAVALLACVLGGKHILFDAPLKALGPEDVRVSAKSYAVAELAKLDADTADDVSVHISKGEDALDDNYRIVIPHKPDMEFSMTGSAIEGTDYITVMEWQSEYFLRDIRWHSDAFDEDGVLYVSSIKTTFLNNRPSVQVSTAMEMRRISKIVYVEDDGTETVLWEE